ncbi:T-lymphocyte activation antigen CD80 isoform X2 [Macrotis lagotis]|uniref:T-lymphocyte activation antigen CD80 isoform X2 n=1 Tax=Macrotis lagotis TaxID=92651 RepID=UPI003D69173C
MAQTGLSTLILLVTYLGFVCSSSGETQIARVNEPATFSCNYNIPKKEMANHRIYWQKAGKVVQAYAPGKKVEDLIDLPYVNRTTPIDSSNNLSITILSLQVADEGTYECIVQKLIGGQYQRVHKYDVKLSIRADFSDPSVSVNEEDPSIWRITCSSRNGYPQPNIFWMNNGKELTSFNTTIFQDPATRLYNVDSEVHVNRTTNLSLICLIKYSDFQLSKNITLKNDPGAVSTHQLIIIPTVISFFIFFIAIMCVNRRNCQRPTWLFFRKS